MALLTVCDLAVGHGQHTVARHISFTLSSGELISIFGENGAGKTTLMKTLLGINAPLSGKMDFSKDVERGQIGYLGQQSQIQKDFPSTVREVVISGCLGSMGRRPFYSSREKAMAQKYMEQCGVWELRNRSYRNLSGGQMQRVRLARALAASSRLLFLDEPTSGLDPESSAGLYRLLGDLKESGTAILMISHDIPSSLPYSDKVLYMGNEVSLLAMDEYLERNGGETR